MKTETREFFKKCMTDVNAFNSQHYSTLTKISDAVQYAWENWEDAITGPHHEGTEKPEFPPKSFIEDWIDNEDFAADGFDEDALDAIAGQGKAATDAARHFVDLYSDEIKAGEEITPDMIYEWWIATKEQYPDSVTADDVENEIFALI